jgi:hypothetical protein
MNRRKNDYAKEVKAMREKAVMLRKLSEAQVIDARTSREAGEPVKVIAARLGVKPNVIYNATSGRGYR